MADNDKISAEEGSLPLRILYELLGSPINIALLALCFVLVYKIFSSKKSSDPPPKKEPELEPLKKQDFTLEQLREYDGKSNDGRILIAVNGKVFDVTKGKRFYGPGGNYGLFAGHDASRALATFSLGEDSLKNDYDDLSDLNTMQMDSVREWEMQFQEEYVCVGKLLKPGEQPTDYSDTEDEEKTEADKKTE